MTLEDIKRRSPPSFIWLTKYTLTRGVLMLKVTHWLNKSVLASEPGDKKAVPQYHLGMCRQGKDWFTSRDAALKDARQKLDAEIARQRKRIQVLRERRAQLK
jgi:hypothetical protein